MAVNVDNKIKKLRAAQHKTVEARAPEAEPRVELSAQDQTGPELGPMKQTTEKFQSFSEK